MCGIFGYVGRKDAVKVTLNGLRRLEYRGYDSAGIGGLYQGQIASCKVVGKIDDLEKEVIKTGLKLDCAIGQTRWATHGRPSQINAHPHFDTNRTLALVHNGIIENHESLRKMLRDQGSVFVSETDTEVAAHLIAHFYEGDLLRAVQEALPLLQGSYALALVHRDYPGQLVAVAAGAPLVIGIGDQESYLSSDSAVWNADVREAMYLVDSEVALVTADEVETFDTTRKRVIKTREFLTSQEELSSKGAFEHYTLKEIFEQPTTLQNAIYSRYVEEYGNAILDGLDFDPTELLNVQRILILACGTSWHAGYIGSYMLEDLARLPTQIEISSEYRYKNPVVPPGTLVIAISQSGETADTIAAVRELKAKGARILAICNVHGSTLVRESDHCIFLRAGREVGVCSTKAFTSQVAVLALFTLLMARMRHMDKSEGQEFIQALKVLPLQIQQVLDHFEQIRTVAKKYSQYENFFFIGRHYMYPTALEAALKLKEISYINANGYPAGELKHGPIALINETCPTVALCANKTTLQKTLSNIQEVRARKGHVIAIVEEEEDELLGIADDLLYQPKTIDPLAPILTAVVTQLFAYQVAYERKCEIDQPRNLAKSVTVE